MSLVVKVKRHVENGESEKAIKLLQDTHNINKRKAEILLEQFLTIEDKTKDKIPKNITPTGLDILSDRDFQDFFKWFFETFTFRIEKEKFIDKKNLMLILSKDNERIIVYANRNNPSEPVKVELVKDIFYKADLHEASKYIIITSSYFSENVISEAKSLKVDLWDYNKFEEKMKGLDEALRKTSNKIYFPEFENDLTTTLKKLDNFQSFYLETKNNSKYLIKKRGVKYPLITYWVIHDKVERCMKCVNEQNFDILKDKEMIDIDLKHEEKAYEEIINFLTIFL